MKLIMRNDVDFNQESHVVRYCAVMDVSSGFEQFRAEMKGEPNARAHSSHFVTILTFCCDVSIAMNYVYRNLINAISLCVETV